MKNIGQTVKGITAEKSIGPNKSASENLAIARLGGFDEGVISILEGLDTLFEMHDEKNPQAIFRVIREAMTDEPIQLQEPPAGGFKNLDDASAWQKLHGNKRSFQIIRKSIMELLKCVANRDKKFFDGVSNFFSKAPINIIAADELRVVLSEIRSFQGHGLLKPLTYVELSEQVKTALPELQFDRRTIQRAAADVGLKIKPDKRGRPSKKSPQPERSETEKAQTTIN